MKFYAEPNLLVTDFASGRKLFNFDENGEYTTQDEALIKRLKVHFRYEGEVQKKRKEVKENEQ